MLENINYIGIGRTIEGNERRREMIKDILSGGTFLPKTVLYEDIDKEFNRWATETIKLKSDEGTEFPTMTLYSNQRFSEYTQSWKYVDDNNNLILNFKTITRDNNPEYGKIQDGLWNIPGERFYLMKRAVVLDDNGSESYLDLRMKQPVAIDLLYSVSIFTTKFQYVNDFNQQINKLFASRQCYIRPNGHYMPMVLESITDNSSYNINDRQFYSQTANIRANCYIITENDYRIEERPKKTSIGVNVYNGMVKKKKAVTEIEEYDKVPIEFVDECGNKKTVILPIKNGKKIEIESEDIFEVEEGRYYYRPVVLTLNFPKLCNKAEFTLDTNFVPVDADYYNLHTHYNIVNEEGETNSFKNGDKLTVKVYILNSTLPSTLVIYGYCPSEIFDVKKDNQEIKTNETQFPFEQEEDFICEQCDVTPCDLCDCEDCECEDCECEDCECDCEDCDCDDCDECCDECDSPVSEIIDLSMVDVNYDELKRRETANCYVIRGEGTYEFPLVYGCGITKGTVVEDCYRHIPGIGTHDFLNYKNEPIGSVFIEEDTGDEITSAEVKLVDVEDFRVDNLLITTNDSGFRVLRFDVSKFPAIGGNATIAVKNESGDTMWSWHLWAYSGVLTTKDEGFLNVNLGFVPNAAGSKYGTSPYYQWGRKDPMLRMNASAHVGSFNIDSIATNLGQTIKNPTTFNRTRFSTYGYNWWYENGETVAFRNFWNIRNYKTETDKTIYDPCPVGFSVPYLDSFKFTIETGGPFDSGYTWDGNYFQTMQFRTENGEISNNSPTGILWSSYDDGSTQIDAFDFNEFNVGLSGHYRAFGVNIRPQERVYF